MTSLLYLNDTYLFEAEAKFIEILENEKGVALILDQTIFYPQGGGQPSDTGTISDGKNTFAVTDTRLDHEGKVWHFGSFEGNAFEIGASVSLIVDKQKRLLNARLHTAGHLLDCAVSKLNIDNFKPTKGFHFEQGPYVEYEGTIEDSQALIPSLKETINQLAAQDLKTFAIELSPEEAQSQGIWAPPGKAARVVAIEGFEHCGCGGTHVASTLEIGKVNIRKIKAKKGVTRVSYSL